VRTGGSSAARDQGGKDGKEGEDDYRHGCLVEELGIRNCCRVKNLGVIHMDPMAFCVGSCILFCFVLLVVILHTTISWRGNR